MGHTYPVFILANSRGEVITRWTGYTGGSQRFIATLNKSLTDLRSVNERVAAFESNPTQAGAVELGKYFADIQDNLQAVEYYRRAAELGPPNSYGYTLEIFLSTANAAWQEEIPFEDVYPTADAVINARVKNRNHIVKVGQIIARLGRKLGKADQIGKYLKAGIEITNGVTDNRIRQSNVELRADYALHIEADTAGAVKIKKDGLPTGWNTDRDQFYAFSKWCLERKINLAEAEILARRAIDMVYPGMYRARVLGTVAEICYARSNTDEAIRVAQLAIEQDPDNAYYAKLLEQFALGEY